VARTKEFDPDVVLGRALDLFWEHGYEATSTVDLVAHLGIARASLYGTFGSKRALYLRALARYIETTDPVVVHDLAGPGAALPAVRELVRRYASESGDGTGRGCMVVNAAVEFAGRDAEAARFVEASWATVETALTSALVRARGAGELAADRDPGELARFLLVLLQGMRVLGRMPDGRARLRAAADTAMALLD